MRAPLRPAPLTLLPLLALLALTACGGPEAQQAQESPAAAAETARSSELSTAQSLGVSNARAPLPRLVTAGQISQEQMDGLASAGVTNFVSLRLADEDGAGWEEDYAWEAELSFTRLPVSGASGLTRETVAALDRILAESSGGPTVLYCGSSNRVGALLALRAYWLQGATPEEALALGRAAGMTRLEGAVTEILASEPALSR